MQDIAARLSERLRKEILQNAILRFCNIDVTHWGEAKLLREEPIRTNAHFDRLCVKFVSKMQYGVASVENCGCTFFLGVD